MGLLGRFNAYNLLAVYGAAVLLGLDRGEVLRVLSMLHAVSGRFEKIRAANGTTAIVDYAHTPDALENVIQTIEEIRTPGQQLIVVCGCGGDRDRTKRPEMAAIAVKYATTAVFTSDNPRHESPEAILDDMVAGLEPGARYLRIADRAEAIRTASLLARPGDLIFFDWDDEDEGQDGAADHVGIVEKADGGIVYTVEGNSGDSCRENRYAIGHYEIYGYGTPTY